MPPKPISTGFGIGFELPLLYILRGQFCLGAGGTRRYVVPGSLASLGRTLNPPGHEYQADDAQRRNGG